MVRTTSFPQGETVYFRRGCVWDTGLDQKEVGLIFDHSGTSVDPITFTNYGKPADPLLQFSNPEDTQVHGRIIQIGASWIVLDGFRIEGIRSVDISEAGQSRNNLL
jgi:hypothetical protein